MHNYIVTGASRGIGKVISEHLLDRGGHVIGIARQFNWHSPFLKQVLLDMSKIKALPVALEELKQDINKLDGIICCAGKGRFGCLEEFSYQQIQEILELNFLSQVYLIRAFLPLLKKHRKGNIIIIGSEAALSGKSQGSIYCASKFALRGFCQALRAECASSGIRVTLINPGMVKTDFFNNLDFECGEHPLEHLLPEDIAKTILFILDSREGAVIDEISILPQKKLIKFKK
jgi:3-hydroxy acid dehydrogenase / malonic semialdehyde reductase